MSEQVCDAGRGADAIVSHDSESLILVDEVDRELGYLSKRRCHEGSGVLHRAFSILIFNSRGELLLQKRSGAKRLWPEYWSNSCCSHPRRGETLDAAVQRRLHEELGIRCPLQLLFKFQYHAQFDEAAAEHELCYVYLGVSDESVTVNVNEVQEWRWLTPDRLHEELEKKDGRFTPWFRIEWGRIWADYRDLIPRAERQSSR